jgi:hypothetical protein
LEWRPKDKDDIKPVKFESSGKTYHIGRLNGEAKLISNRSDATFVDLLCTNDQTLQETNENNFIFKRSF